MAPLLTLPDALILCVFEELADLDDVMYLERVCKRFHHFLERGRNRLTVYKAIIVRAPHHNASPTDQLGVFKGMGLPVLQDLYLDPSMQIMFRRPEFSYFHMITEEQFELLEKECNLEPPQLSKSKNNTPQAPLDAPFGSKQVHRFYQALTARWLAVEALTLFRVSRDNGRDLPEGTKPTRTLSDALDILEVGEFVGGFLVLKIFANIAEHPSWCASHQLGPRSMPRIGIGEQEGRMWGEFVRNIQQYLRPPNIIELLLLSPKRQQWSPSKKGHYLWQLGAFDTLSPTLRGSGKPCLNIVERALLRRLEYGVTHKVIHPGSDLLSPGSDFWRPGYLRWGHYREFHWAEDARGRVLSWDDEGDWVKQYVLGRLPIDRLDHECCKGLSGS
ncbi:hypothetical protein AJ80_03240 [Polytolypa hystricis UAMH7299]|uniref:F-box domain-containing protein n=1 Tax=Polytolypa hystricis (strain UAMH7299) TaxID=1447883 RepID=A0A2B7YK65_POLH7|nr:hypothetical protein AJ80_03240 [Polytolypa hystricis UAMH7299]